MAFDRSLFDQARAVLSVDALAAGVTDLKRAGSELRGICPLCGSGKKNSASAPFAVKPGKGSWRCYVCDAHGDVVDLEQQLRGGTPIEAARRLVGNAPLPARTSRPVERVKAPEGPSASDRVAAEILAGRRPFAGSPAERYLRGRGVTAAVLALAGHRMAFHPAAKWGWDEAARRWITAPALVLEVVTPAPDGEPVPTGGVHCTYLAPAGAGKAALDPAKKMWGPQGADGRPGVAWLFGDPKSAPLFWLTVGEGLETVLSRVSMDPHPQVGMAMAALSLDRLQGGVLRDDEGCIDAFDPQANPERPPATWPGRWNVRICIDRDMGPMKVKARTGRGKVCDFIMDGEARARLCARLAVRGWKAAGAYHALAEAPPPGSDFNDELRRRAQQRAVA